MNAAGLVVTETRTDPPGNAEILEFAREAGIPYCQRYDRSREKIRLDEGVEGVVIWQPEGPVLYQDEKTFFFHPSMGKNRLARLRRGQPDVMVTAMKLEPGMKVLDCTLGLAADALVASYCVGVEGEVLGIEASPVIAALVKWGIKKYPRDPVWLKDSLEHITIVCGDHQAVLKGLADRSYDIVYFDPMFRRPVWESNAILPMRKWANADAIAGEAVAEARRVAKQRVVLKERWNSGEFERLKFDQVVSGKKSTIAYGVIEVDEK
jgi:hypothetical protein